MALIGGVVGGASIIFLIFLGIFCYRRSRQRHGGKSYNNLGQRDGEDEQTTIGVHRNMPHIGTHHLSPDELITWYSSRGNQPRAFPPDVRDITSVTEPSISEKTQSAWASSTVDHGDWSDTSSLYNDDDDNNKNTPSQEFSNLPFASAEGCKGVRVYPSWTYGRP